MGHLELGFRETHYAALEEAQSGHAFIFLPALKENLVTHANAQERPVRLNPFPDQGGQPLAAELFSAVSERTHARQHQMGNALRILRRADQMAVHSGGFKRIQHTAEIARPVINHTEFHGLQHALG